MILYLIAVYDADLSMDASNSIFIGFGMELD